MFRLCLLDQKKLCGIRGDDLIFGVGCDDFKRRVFESGKKDAFSAVRLQEQKLLFFGKVKRLHDDGDGRGRLLEKQLERGVGYDRLAIRRIQKVADVLRDRSKAEIVFARALGNTEEK